MSGVIIGTAGHVDHGKTALIKALTGVDTDRLKEEKKRGITIELGFAYLDLPGGGRAGIIDVPGHEKFISNMLAGAGGIDLALLAVAADDGVMPQTREHLGILSLLNIKDGIIVITKSDLADPDWIEMVKEDIAKEAAGTFLEHADMVAVSAHTGNGIGGLRELIIKKAASISAKSADKPFRVPVDRVFSVDGFGTVITGTMIEGALKTGDEVEVYPSGRRARVRNLQVHSQDVETALAGQRAAVNLSGINKSQISRGDTLAPPGSMKRTMMLDCKLRILKDSGRTIENGSRMHFYHGSREVLCKVVLLAENSLAPGREGYAQLRFAEELAVKKTDRFVVRFYSPVETIGGGVVLDAHPKKHKRYDKKTLNSLKTREYGSEKDRIYQAVHDASAALIQITDAASGLLLEEKILEDGLEALAKEGRIIKLGGRHAVSAEYFAALTNSLEKILSAYHAENPLQAGMRKDELKSRLLPGREMAAADLAIAAFVEKKIIRVSDGRASLSSFKIKSDEVLNKIEALYRQGGCTPPDMAELESAFPKEKNIKKRLEAMLSAGTLIAAGPQIYFHRDTIAEAETKISGFIAKNGSITLAGFRDLSGSSRKFALAILEYFDRHGVTKKSGDIRTMNK